MQADSFAELIDFPEGDPEGSETLTVEYHHESDDPDEWTEASSVFYRFPDGSVLEVRDDWGEFAGCQAYPDIAAVLKSYRDQDLVARVVE